MHTKSNEKARAPRTSLFSTSLQEFLRTEKIALSTVAVAFLKRHQVTTIGELLEVSLIQESRGVLRTINPLRNALARRRITVHRYKFLMSYI